MYTVQVVCSRCDATRIITITQQEQTALEEFHAVSKRPHVVCTRCGDTGIDIELLDPYHRVVAVAPPQGGVKEVDR